MDIGNRLRKAREAIGYPQRKVFELTGIGESSLSDYENSKREPRFSELSKLAEVYKRAIDFFLTDKPLVENLMLWRRDPDTEEKKAIESEFRQQCQQYRRLEVIMNEIRESELPYISGKPEQFDFHCADLLAEKVQKLFQLGDIPSASLKQILEERYYVKIFHLSFTGGAISTVSEGFGPAILLNKESKQWVRNYDLAHELFHLLTWNIFRAAAQEEDNPGEYEEKLANAFASKLLLPTDLVKKKVESVINDKKEARLEAMDEVAREFGVSLDALLWRLVYLYGLPSEKIEGYLQESKKAKVSRPTRQSDTPDELPERYCSLAIRALRDGRLSLIKFAKYMRISYKQARDYLTEDKDFTDEKISITVA